MNRINYIAKKIKRAKWLLKEHEQEIINFLKSKLELEFRVDAKENVLQIYMKDSNEFLCNVFPSIESEQIRIAHGIIVKDLSINNEFCLVDIIVYLRELEASLDAQRTSPNV